MQSLTANERSDFVDGHYIYTKAVNTFWMDTRPKPNSNGKGKKLLFLGQGWF